MKENPYIPIFDEIKKELINTSFYHIQENYVAAIAKDVVTHLKELDDAITNGVYRSLCLV